MARGDESERRARDDCCLNFSSAAVQEIHGGELGSTMCTQVV